MTEPKILIVDDEPAIRDMIGITLDLAGFKSAAAETAQQAYVDIVDNRPDLILLDWMLPGGSGIELARRLKRSQPVPQGRPGLAHKPGGVGVGKLPHEGGDRGIGQAKL